MSDLEKQKGKLSERLMKLFLIRIENYDCGSFNHRSREGSKHRVVLAKKLTKECMEMIKEHKSEVEK